MNDFQDYIKNAVELKEGDIIKAGRTYLRVHIIPEEPPGPPKYTCVKCNKELGELETKPFEDIGAGDFICEECKKEKPHFWVKEEKKIEKQPFELVHQKIKEKPEKEKEVERKERVEEEIVVGERFKIRCFNCGQELADGRRDLDWKVEVMESPALYLCERCVFAERIEKKKINNYMLLRKIGMGGMGVVYKAWDKPTRRIVAIKELLPDKLMDERALKVFHREISVTHDLIHPNIVRFYDSFTKGGKPYLVTEYLPGGNAEDLLLKNRQPFTIEQACRIVLQTLEGLSYAHEKGFVHRDVKPQNILFNKDGMAKLSDMGLAKSFELAGQSGITAPGETGGTLVYMAPEQILDFRFVKPPADVYSVGVCLYYFLTGKFPYHLPSALDILMKMVKIKERDNLSLAIIATILENEPIPILERKPDLLKPLAAVIDQCLKKEPKERFRDADELKDAIKRAIE